LSEDFIREFSDRVNWYQVSWSRKLSEEFMLEFYDKLDWEGLKKKNEIDKNIFKKMNGEQKLYVMMNYRKIWDERIE
jgi:hypothetical protein